MCPNALPYHQNIPFVTMVSELPADTVHKDPKVTGSILATCKKGFLSGYEIGIVGSTISVGIVQLFNQYEDILKQGGEECSVPRV